MNSIENYLEKNRDLLDTAIPDDEKIWGRINTDLSQKGRGREAFRRTGPAVRVLRIAALVFILFSVGYIARDVIGLYREKQVVTLSDINAGLGKKENEYRILVSVKTAEAKAYPQSDSKLIRELFSEIRNLDAVYDQSLRDLKELGYNEKIVNTIFDTYEKKIQLLELIILESNKPSGHENNGKASV